MSLQESTQNKYHWSTIIVSFIGPILVFGLFWTVTMGSPDDEVLDERIQKINEEIQENSPEILFIGSSLLGRGVDGDLLSEELEIDTHVLWRANASTPEWYAILKNRVYGNNVKPKVIVITSTLMRMLLSEPRGDQQRMQLLQQMGDFEPIINKKTFGQDVDDSSIGLLRFRRSQLKERILDGIKGLAMLQISSTATTIDEGIQEAEPILEQIFGGENAKDYDFESRVIPVVDTRLADDLQKKNEDSGNDYIEEFINLAHENGSRIIFVNLPISTLGGVGSGSREYVSNEDTKNTIQKMQKLGAGYIDLSNHERLGITDKEFRDVTHLNEAGQKVVTLTLRDIFQKSQILNRDKELPIPQMANFSETWTFEGTEITIDSVKWKQSNPEYPCLFESRWGTGSSIALNSVNKGFDVPFRIEKEGQLLDKVSKLEELHSEECLKSSYLDRRRIYVSIPPEELDELRLTSSPELFIESRRQKNILLTPNRTIKLQLEGISSEKHIQLSMVGRVIKESSQKGVITLPNGNKIQLQQTGDRVYSQPKFNCEAETCSVEIHAQQNGPFYIFTDIELRFGNEKIMLLGKDFSSAFQVKLNVSIDKEAHEELPPPIIDFTPEITINVLDQGEMDITNLAWLSNNNIAKKSFYQNATPFVVLEDGQPMKLTDCRSLRKIREVGSYCELNSKVQFLPSDGADPTSNPQRYQLVFKQDRSNKGKWLYPGDTLTYKRKGHRMKGFTEGPNGLEIKGWAFTADPTDSIPMQLKVFSDQNMLLDKELTATGDWGNQTLPLGEGFVPLKPMKVHFTNPKNSNTFYLIQSVHIMERFPFVDERKE